MEANSLQVPTVAALRASFPIAPETYKLSKDPTNTEIKKLRACVKANLKATNCLLPYTEDVAWAWLITSPSDWRKLHSNETQTRIATRLVEITANQLDTDPTPAEWTALHDEDTQETARLQWRIDHPNSAIPDYEDPPPMPNPVNPGMFTIKEMNANRYTRAKEQYMQDVYSYTYRRNIEKAILKDLDIAIPKELVTDIQDESGSFTTTSISAILQLMETTFKQLLPKDISIIMDTFREPMDQTLTLAEYFKRQQDCQHDLKDTLEPISTATMIRTCYAHILALPHMAQACDDWELQNPNAQATTWVKFKAFFTQRFRQYNNRKASLHDAGIANSATSNYTALQAELANVHAENHARDANLAHFVQQNQLLSQQVQSLASIAGNTPPPVPHVSFPEQTSVAMNTTATNEMMTAINAINRRIDQLATTTAPAATNTRQAFVPRTKRKFKNDNYCWTHGCDLHPKHTGLTCNTKAAGHQDTATITNRMGGSDRHLSLVT